MRVYEKNFTFWGGRGVGEEENDEADGVRGGDGDELEDSSWINDGGGELS